MYVAYWRSASYEFLSRFYYLRFYPRSILVAGKILQSMRWWIFYVGFRYSMCVDVVGFQSHHLLRGCEIRWWQTVVAYSSGWLLASRAILARISFPPVPLPMTMCFCCWFYVLHNRGCTTILWFLIKNKAEVYYCLLLCISLVRILWWPAHSNESHFGYHCWWQASICWHRHRG